MAVPTYTFISHNPYGLDKVSFLANPTFVDIDGDGDMDAFVGDYYGNTQFFKNTGTANCPAFAAANINPFGLGDVGFSANPTFVDIENDGDMDAFVGNSAGNTQFFKNAGNANSPAFAAANTNPFGLSDVGLTANPTFADIDGDGDVDAFVGNSVGNTLFFRNAGTSDSPAFAVATTNPFGLSNVGSNASPSIVDIDGDGDKDVLLGASNGTVFFRNTETVTNPVFVNIGTNLYGLGQVGGDEHPTLVDIDGDGDLDAFVGDSYSYRMSNGGNTVFFVNDGLLLVSTVGNETLTGTPSPNDVVTYVSAPVAVTVSLLTTTSQNTIGAGHDTLINIENLIGSNFNDNLTGDAKHNLLIGGAGNDTLRGWSGVDTMIGGLGNDSYFVENVGDVVTEKFNQGTDNVRSNVTYTLLTNVENITLTGNTAINGTGNFQANVITGNVASNHLNGKAGNDTLDGKSGSNVLTGGTGNDIFRFTTKGHIDAITDYNVTNDTVQLENAVFAALTAPGTLAASHFRIGTQAVDANDFIIYNSAAGKLLYDADGSGAGAAVQIATIGTGLNLTNADIVVI